jgi:hypothetical protein
MEDVRYLEVTQFVLGQQVDVLQWWASVTFALVALAQFAKKSLNLGLVVVASAIVSDLASKVAALTRDASLNLTGEHASNVSRYLVGPNAFVSSFVYEIFLGTAVVGTFLAAIYRLSRECLQRFPADEARWPPTPESRTLASRGAKFCIDARFRFWQTRSFAVVFANFVAERCRG